MRLHSTMVAEMIQATKTPPVIQAETKRISEILDTKYQAENLKEICKDIPELSKEDMNAIYRLLKSMKYYLMDNWVDTVALHM